MDELKELNLRLFHRKTEEEFKVISLVLNEDGSISQINAYRTIQNVPQIVRVTLNDYLLVDAKTNAPVTHIKVLMKRPDGGFNKVHEIAIRSERDKLRNSDKWQKVSDEYKLVKF